MIVKRQIGWIALLVCGVIALCADPCGIAQTDGRQGPQLSSAETGPVNRKIATLHSSADRKVAQSWSNAKKVAEVLCRPVALTTLQRTTSGVDRVFLGTDAPDSLSLESNRRLIGSGQFRTPQGWQDFTFTCELNPETGKATSFQTGPARQ